MVRLTALIWVSYLVSVSIGLADTDTNKIGVNWGTMASHPLHPITVVEMLKANGIKKVKLFGADEWTVSALAGSEMEVMLGIPNNQLIHISKSYDKARDWVKENVTRYIHKGGVDIKYVSVGNEPFLTSYNGSFLNTTLPAMKNIQQALNAAGLQGKIKVTCAQNADVYNSPDEAPIPSTGNFRSDIRGLMIEMVKFLQSNDAPFVVNIYPFLSLYDNKNFPFDFALFDGAKNPLQDNGRQYNNVFDANFDTLVWSLKKSGVPNMKIIIGEVGWPTEGDLFANVTIAKKFYDGFLKKMHDNKGTPLRPDPVDVYLFGLFDEDQKSVAPGGFERHWGIFRYDGQPKFPMDLSGEGRNRNLVAAKGVQYLPSQWCVLNKKVTNLSRLSENVNYACSLGDCTALSYGSSCNNLGQAGNASYAFNMYFQIQDQDVRACDFQGLAVITNTNASTATCLFPVQIVSAGERPMTASLLTTVLVIVLVFVG